MIPDRNSTQADEDERKQVTQELALRFSGQQLFLVGGCVRDELLGRRGGDLDFATDCRPEETRARVESWADELWTVGEKFGTIGLRKGNVKAEITTFRRESYQQESRHPQVRFQHDLQSDLERRDFTINAMARAAPEGKLVDPFGGQADLARRLVRFVGRSAERIQEDPLRMLRGVRFCAQLDFQLEEETELAIRRQAGELQRISRERIREEFEGILLSERPARGIRQVVALGLARSFLPELEGLHLPQAGGRHLKDVLDHTLEAVELAPRERVLRWALLLHDIAKPETFSEDEAGVHFYRHEELGAEKAAAILQRLRVPREVVERVAKLVRNHLRIPSYRAEWSQGAVRRLMFELGEDLEAAMALSVADVRASDPSDYGGFVARLNELEARMAEVGRAQELVEMRPLLNGEEIMVLLGIAPGPRVGEVIRHLMDRQVEGDIATKEEATREVLARFGDKLAGGDAAAR